MYASLLNVFHHAADEHAAYVVAHGIHVTLNRIVQKAIQQNG